MIDFPTRGSDGSDTLDARPAWIERLSADLDAMAILDREANAYDRGYCDGWRRGVRSRSRGQDSNRLVAAFSFGVSAGMATMLVLMWWVI